MVSTEKNTTDKILREIQSLEVEAGIEVKESDREGAERY